MAHPDHLCQEHSGILMWMRINAGLLTVALSLLTYSSFVQVPNLRTDIAKEMAKMENDIRKELREVEDRVTKLEARVK